MPIDFIMDAELLSLATRLGQQLAKTDKKLAVSESCTGGLIAAAITEIAGSSGWFDRGFVTYSNSAKQQMLAVQSQTLANYGAVSEQTALEMAAGTLAFSEADCAVAVTGIAGPGGGTLSKPVGSVYIAWAFKGQKRYCELNQFQGDRHAIRLQTAKRALQYLIAVLEKKEY